MERPALPPGATARPPGDAGAGGCRFRRPPFV